MRQPITSLFMALLLLPALTFASATPVAADHLQTNASANTTAALNLRAGPGTGNAVLRVIPEGERVFVVSGPTSGHWYEITYEHTRGFVFGDYLAQNTLFLALEPETGPPGTEVTIYGSGAEPNEEIRILAVHWPATIPCDAGRGADPIATVVADATGRFRATHTPQRVVDDQAGYTYVADKPRQPGRTSEPVCFEFTTEPRSRFFPETGFTLSGEFLAFWERNGGLATFGYPLTSAFNEESLTDGRVYRVQYFERQRFELHPENNPPYNVLIGLMSYETLPGEALPPPRAAPVDRAGCTYVEPTGHNVCDRFLTYWQQTGGLTIYGYPISEPYRATLEDGQEHLIQYFERARFEWHPENNRPYDVLLGQLGREVLNARYGGPPPRAR